MKLKEISKSWYFLLIMVIVYILSYFFYTDIFTSSISFAWKIFESIIPLLFIIFAIMLIVNKIFETNIFKKYLLSRRKRTWFVAIGTGILSTGPIYMWYPLLNDLQKRGARPGFIATFLYNRAIKIPMLPMLIFYFGLTYTIVLTIVMIIFSLIDGFIVEKIFEVVE